MCRTSIYDARNNFSALVKCAEEGEVVELTRYDKPVAVIISYSAYEHFESKTPDLIDKLQALKDEYSDVVDDIGLDFMKFRKEYTDVLDDVGFDISPSRECPDYSKDPWA